MPDDAPISIRLTWQNLTTQELQERLLQLPVTIGRSTNNTITFNSNQISRRHVTIEEDGDTVVVIDNESTNGTQLNGETVQRASLTNGDVLQLGPFSVTVEIVSQLEEELPDNSITLSWRDPDTEEDKEVIAEMPVSIGRSGNSDIALSTAQVSRSHAIISLQEGQVVINDQGSSNGTYVNGEQVESASLFDGDILRIGNFELAVSFAASVSSGRSSSVVRQTDATLLFDEAEAAGSGLLADADAVEAAERAEDQFPATESIDPADLERQIEAAPGSSQPLPAPARSFPPPSFDDAVVSVAQLRNEGFPLEETKFLAVGGGVGSFIWIDNLVIYGVPTSDIKSIGFEPKPYGRYQRLCVNSQIPPHERLRSNSDSTPDNIWGFPSYSVREIVSDLVRFRLGSAIKATFQMFGEPNLIATYTPKSGQVFDSIDREAKRIGWDKMWRYGRVRAIRKTDDGRYAIAYSQSTDDGRVRRIMLAKYVHVAIGYPGVRFLRDLQKYRQETGDFQSVVNAYEEHEHVYDDLRRNGGTVLIRGRGIVASRIIQKLYETRQQNNNINLLHLMRSPNTIGQKAGFARRPVENHWEFQPFNWPKAAWGGDLRYELEKSDDDVRDQLLNDWGGTTTADRPDWKQIVSGGIRDGWYVIRFGNVDRVERNEDGRLNTVIRGTGDIGEEVSLVADYIIDGTGLESGIDRHPLLKDMLEMYNLKRNPKGRLDVGNDFEIHGMDNNGGKMYAAGVSTLGGPYAPVDSFLGLQYSAQRSVDSLAKTPGSGVKYMRGIRSFFQWVKWATNAAP